MSRFATSPASSPCFAAAAGADRVWLLACVRVRVRTCVQQELEQERYQHRQRMLAELEQLRARETDIKRAAELDARSLTLEEDRLREMERSLRTRYVQHGACCC